MHAQETREPIDNIGDDDAFHGSVNDSLMYSIYSQVKSQDDAQEVNNFYETSDYLLNDVPQGNLSENDVYLLRVCWKLTF